MNFYSSYNLTDTQTAQNMQDLQNASILEMQERISNLSSNLNTRLRDLKKEIHELPNTKNWNDAFVLASLEKMIDLVDTLCNYNNIFKSKKDRLTANHKQTLIIEHNKLFLLSYDLADLKFNKYFYLEYRYYANVEKILNENHEIIINCVSKMINIDYELNDEKFCTPVLSLNTKSKDIQTLLQQIESKLILRSILKNIRIVILFFTVLWILNLYFNSPSDNIN